MNPVMRVVLWTPFANQAEHLGQALGAIEGLRLHVAHSEAEAIAQLPEADAALLTGHTAGYTAAVARAVHHAARLRWLQMLSTGVDGLEQHGAPAHVSVTGIAGAGSAVVAEHAMALLLALLRQLPQALVQGRRGEWDRSLLSRMSTLEDAVLGLVGFGAIGQAVALRARAFGARCLAANRSGRDPSAGLAEQTYPMERLHDMLGRCDALVLSLPLAAGTSGLMGTAEWAACKRGVCVVNVGRGAVVDTPSLLAALDAGQVAAAGLDVTDPEPLPPDHALWRHPSALITPHVAGGGSPAVLRRVVDVAVDNTRRFLGNAPLRGLLSMPERA